MQQHKIDNIIEIVTNLWLNKSPDVEYLDSFYAIQEKYGWSFHAKGGYAVVFLSPCNKIALRLSIRNGDSYPYFAQAAIENSNNPYFPKIYWHAYSDIYKNINITLMEPPFLKVPLVNKNLYLL